MADPAPLLTALLQSAMASAYGPALASEDPVLRPSDHADYQANAAMKLAKSLGMAPREFATTVAAALADAPELASVEVAGPGFLNLTLADSFVASLAAAALGDESGRLGVAPSSSPQTFVIDYSHPNVAKEMHVGHLRSTIIGDWGTPFGMLIEHLLDLGEDAAAAELSLGDLTAFYQAARVKFDADPAFADRSRQRVVLLQSGDDQTLRLWHVLVEQSAAYFNTVYRRLGVLLTDDDLVGESFYNPWLDEVASELEARGIARIDDGALCAFPPGFTNRDGEPLPLIIRKSDGGYGYQATDLAAVRYRVREVGATRVVYVVDAGQSQHLEMVFAVARQAGWLEGAVAEQAAFGLVLGPDKKRLKTRAGDSVKLIELLDEAVERALKVVREKSPGLSSDEHAAIAEAVGIGAVKYADLSNDRVKDYVFDWDRMLSFDGNTAPYLQYAHARIKSILRRAEGEAGGAATLLLTHPAERALALQALAFESAVQAAAESFQPHKICTYLFELASTFTAFYEACPVLRAASDEERASRLALCELTAQTLSTGLALLGIESPDRM